MSHIEQIVIPKMGLIVEEVTIKRWLKKEGDIFKKGEPLLEVEAEKATNEVEAPFTGKLLRILAKEGEVVRVGSPVAEAEILEE